MTPQFIPRIPKTQKKQMTPMAVSVKDAAALLSIGERSVWNLAKRGEIQSRKIGSRVVFVLSSLETFLQGTSNSVQKQK